MRLTIIKSDGLVSIDGLPFTGIDTSSLPVDFHALQWYGASGEIEKMDPSTRAMSNEKITSIQEYQPFINAWNVKKQEYDAWLAAQTND